MIAVSYDLIDWLQLVCVAVGGYLGFGITWNFFNFLRAFCCFISTTSFVGMESSGVFAS